MSQNSPSSSHSPPGSPGSDTDFSLLFDAQVSLFRSSEKDASYVLQGRGDVVISWNKGYKVLCRVGSDDEFYAVATIDAEFLSRPGVVVQRVMVESPGGAKEELYYFNLATGDGGSISFQFDHTQAGMEFASYLLLCAWVDGGCGTPPSLTLKEGNLEEIPLEEGHYAKCSWTITEVSVSNHHHIRVGDEVDSSVRSGLKYVQLGGEGHHRALDDVLKGMRKKGRKITVAPANKLLGMTAPGILMIEVTGTSINPPRSKSVISQDDKLDQRTSRSNTVSPTAGSPSFNELTTSFASSRIVQRAREVVSPDSLSDPDSAKRQATLRRLQKQGGVAISAMRINDLEEGLGRSEVVEPPIIHSSSVASDSSVGKGHHGSFEGHDGGRDSYIPPDYSSLAADADDASRAVSPQGEVETRRPPSYEAVKMEHSSPPAPPSADHPSGVSMNTFHGTPQAYPTCPPSEGGEAPCPTSSFPVGKEKKEKKYFSRTRRGSRMGREKRGGGSFDGQRSSVEVGGPGEWLSAASEKEDDALLGAEGHARCTLGDGAFPVDTDAGEPCVPEELKAAHKTISWSIAGLLHPTFIIIRITSMVVAWVLCAKHLTHHWAWTAPEAPGPLVVWATLVLFHELSLIRSRRALLQKLHAYCMHRNLHEEKDVVDLLSFRSRTVFTMVSIGYPAAILAALGASCYYTTLPTPYDTQMAYSVVLVVTLGLASAAASLTLFTVVSFIHFYDIDGAVPPLARTGGARRSQAHGHSGRSYVQLLVAKWATIRQLMREAAEIWKPILLSLLILIVSALSWASWWTAHRLISVRDSGRDHLPSLVGPLCLVAISSIALLNLTLCLSGWTEKNTEALERFLQHYEWRQSQEASEFRVDPSEPQEWNAALSYLTVATSRAPVVWKVGCFVIGTPIARLIASLCILAATSAILGLPTTYIVDALR